MVYARQVARTFRRRAEFNPCLLPTFSFFPTEADSEVPAVNKPRRACLYFRTTIFRILHDLYEIRIAVYILIIRAAFSLKIGLADD
jgi:hypothetical protein